ncbi:MAG: methyl-accepting chemotaxis protein [Lachnospiraceae bacterium]|nr:methyl-accepting chemotaxis protein [Lachnospiraceae bacterium]
MKRERKGHLVGKVIALAVACAVAVGMLIGIVGIVEVRTTYLNMTEEELRAACMQADSEFTKMWDGDWAYDGGVLTKGGQEVYEEYAETLEELKSQTDLEYTIFYNDTRAVTTLKDSSGQLMIGTTASQAVVSEVIGSGKNVYRQNLDIGGIDYYGYYAPMCNDDGTAVGMMFVGRPSADINRKINGVMMLMGIVLAAGILILIVVGSVMAKLSGKAMNQVAEVVAVLAEGNLTVDVDERLIARNDEVGTIAEDVEALAGKLRTVMGNARGLSNNVSKSGDELSNSSQQAAAASSQVTDAVDDISKGAVSQAESVQDSASNVSNIGDDIDTISSNVGTLSDYTKEMAAACHKSMEALELLLQQNSGVVVSMTEIDAATRKTNDAVQNITNATQLITDIASQTNLLALNASIEAARAGEAGRGFAVVAEEIKDLADQSSKTADEIKAIIEGLAVDSRHSVETISRLNEELDAQSKQIDETKGVMEEMEQEVTSVTESTGEIAERIRALDDAKNNLLTIIEDLSAISEENAASTQQTNASMEELNATFEIINQSADELKGLANELDQQIGFFQIDKA